MKKPPRDARLNVRESWRPDANAQPKFRGEREELLLSKLRVENAVDDAAATDCGDCAALQQKSGDATAMCRPHLQKALGL